MSSVAGEAPEFVWPDVLRPAGLTVIYLDLNHWISLAKADTGHKHGARFEDALAACRQVRAARKAVFPLSVMHYTELAKIENPRQRAELAKVMEELSGFSSLVDPVSVKRSEIRALLAAVGVLPPSASAGFELLGRGVGFSIGRQMRPVVRDDAGNDITAVLMADPQWRAFLAEGTDMAERMILTGPSDQEAPRLKAMGWDPRAAWGVAEKRAAAERDQVTNLDQITKPWRKGRLLDVIAGREVMIELKGEVERLLQEVETQTEEEKDRIIHPLLQGIRRMPSTEVSMALKLAMHRDANRARGWKANDVVDVDAMSLAVPYCDVVVTENASHEVLTAAHLDKRANTTILRNLTQLEAFISTLH